MLLFDSMVQSFKKGVFKKTGIHAIAQIEVDEKNITMKIYDPDMGRTITHKNDRALGGKTIVVRGTLYIFKTGKDRERNIVHG
jgi:hypothetical protein